MKNKNFGNRIKKNAFIRSIFFPYIFIKRKISHLKREIKTERLDEIFNKFKGGKVIISVKEFRGDFEIDVRSHIFKRLIYDGFYEPELLKIVSKYLKPNKDVLDIGANVGFYSILFSELISKNNKVLSIEPIPSAYNSLLKNIKINNCNSKMLTFNGIATDKKGTYKINFIEGMEEYSSIGQMVHNSIKGQEYKTISVEGDTINNLVKKNKLTPGFIKIDTEGAEYKVLQGMKNTLQKYHPIILSELSEYLLTTLGDSTEKVFNLVKKFDYKIYDANNLYNEVQSPFEGDILAIHMDI
ncbi:MAG: FkbM family methyltransferase [Candidatus Lokiarchaeota archaeon]|nr:FkbM family methyltransferase [Candidatus Lokiarchaeota archaeon]